jgi:hypothetical protein
VRISGPTAFDDGIKLDFDVDPTSRAALQQASRRPTISYFDLIIGGAFN